METQQTSQSGQGIIEYGLIIVFIVIAVLVILSALGPGIRENFEELNFFSKKETKVFLKIKDEMLDRIKTFYIDNDRWPRSWGSYAYTDIGLDPDDWDDPVAGIYWRPHGSDIGLANRSGDNLQIYVDDLSGNTLHLYDGWNIWCPVMDTKCYYHTIAPENEIDINSLVVIEE